MIKKYRKKFKKLFFKYLRRTQRFVKRIILFGQEKMFLMRQYLQQYIFWQKIEYYTIYYYTILESFLQEWIQKHPFFFENIQLFIVYFFSIISTCKYIRGTVNFYPLALQLLVPFCKKLGSSPYLAFLGHQNFSYIVIILVYHVFFKKKWIKLSKTILFHILLVLNLEFLINTVIDWILLFLYPSYPLISLTQCGQLGDIYLNIVFLLSYMIYIYCFTFGLKREMPIFPKALSPLNLLVSSTAFWVHLVSQENANRFLNRRE